ncbi:MAG: transcription-repair coupling factor [Oscillospiraceae bacterium]|jgi:transcription-repair coupling factor (superfamily II helicase)
MKWLKLIENTDVFKSLSDSLKKGSTTALFGLQPSMRPVFASAVAETLGKPVIILLSTDSEAARLTDDINSFGGRAVQFPSREYSFPDADTVSHSSERIRLSTMGRLADRTADIVCCSAESYISRTMPRAVFDELTSTVKIGDTIGISELAGRLVRAGYSRTEIVDGIGCFSVKGGIIDVFPCDSRYPCRIEFWGDSVDTMRLFDKDTQRRIRDIDSITIPPSLEAVSADDGVPDRVEQTAKKVRSVEYSALSARDAEMLRNGGYPASLDRYIPVLYDSFSTITDYAREAVTIVFELNSIMSELHTLYSAQSGMFADLHKRGLCAFRRQDFYSDFDPSALRSVVFSDVFARSLDGVKLDSINSITVMSVPRVQGGYGPAAELVRGYTASGESVIIYAPTERSADMFVRDFITDGISAERLSQKTIPEPGVVYLAVGSPSAGFEYPEGRIAVLSIRSAASRRSPAPVQSGEARKAAAKRDAEMFGSLEDLKPGDYVVHRNHGIGRYEGVERIDHHGMVKDYIKIAYRDSDVLYLPVDQLNMISPYVSVKDDGPVRLAKLYSGEWQKTKKNVYRSVKEMTKELMALYSERSKVEGIAFSEDDDWQMDFESRFIYEETDDQLNAAREIKEDMEKPRPMDRLLCGDVGVGKTEVALRAAFKCVNDSYQCAVLVPTTILAWQHYSTFVERMSPYPIKIAMLSRFSSSKDIAAALKGIKDGTVDIVIGTHRLLQKDVQFKRLGLLIVDEEQRFGVSHKEKLKQQYPNIDVLTLSATPIPRTLNMAMSGIRDMSVIEQPPEDRQPVMTYVLEYNQATIDGAISRELARGGQVYYLHNRVDSIEETAMKLRERFPEARIEVGHGKMSEEQLSGVWRRVIDNEVDILVCTTIIETGVDVPNCNTLIVENADRMGLAQLYQIRGRVGRSARRAYAYFTFRPDYVMNENAEKRLSAIRDFTSFGSGFKIAMRDLQIRGSGGILSAKQSGHIATVGYETYLELLEQAVAEEKGEKPAKQKTECIMDLSVNAYIPEDYIPDDSSRISMYKRIASIETDSDADDVRDELEDRFGKIPPEVSSLVNISLGRSIASDLGIYEIKADRSNVIMYKDNLDTSNAGKAQKLCRGHLMWSPSGKSYVSAEIVSGETADSTALEAVKALRTAWQPESS